ncbi:se25 [Alphabaculovirus alterspexiguae]|uniref:Se25 n=1 Tax=Spodoptera exigua multiple nucleopolyhedrovirus TaxID=10454 RepID=A0A3G2JTX0_9ABAC|nr:se25 [Spodoptera exigua multiple nucleopolyhedrovirus]AYN44985.1 se25 [Spodoptera exigua multiple nucleopolyhedrovirus]
MQICVYTLAVTSVGTHDVEVVSKMIDKYFYPIFMIHSAVDTLAVCEDKMYVDNDVYTFVYYENFLRNKHVSNQFAVTIQEYGDLNMKIPMIKKVVYIVTNNNGVIVLSDYY